MLVSQGPIRWFEIKKNVIVKVSKAFKLMAKSRLELVTLGIREKHLNLLSRGGVLIS